MSSENPNNLHWKDKLEDTDGLSGEILRNKSATWRKMHNRLSEKPNRKKDVWYWAAACLIPAIIVSLMIVYKSESHLVKNNVGQGGLTLTKLNEIHTIRVDTIAVVAALPTVSVRKRAIIKSEIESNTNNRIAFTNEGLLGTKDNIRIDANQMVSSNPFVDSPDVTFVSLAHVRKKLKVVHINELGDPVEGSPDISRNADLHSFQLKLANEEVYINPSVASNSTGFIFPKTKTSNAGFHQAH